MNVGEYHVNTGEPEHRIAVIGGGVMGANIAALAIGHGIPVVLVEVDDAALTRAKDAVRQKLRHAQLMGALPPGRQPGEFTQSLSVTMAAAGATAVIEAVTELRKTKEQVLTEVSAAVRPGTLLISNTSCIPIDELAESVVRRDELVGVHFMNPAYLIKMVEVIRGTHTSDATMAAVQALLTALGRQSLVVHDSPGFVINRLLHPLINIAARVVDEGVASVEVVDGLVEGCLGHSTGPLRTADLIGLDNLVDSLKVLYARTGEESCRPCEGLLEKVRAGHLGRKSGQGFYDYGKVAS
jgi:methoxymalonate biosynthesis protein